jgi:hypothetical protein
MGYVLLGLLSFCDLLCTQSGMLLSQIGLCSIVLAPLEITHYVHLDFHTVKYFCTHVTSVATVATDVFQIN